MTDDVALTGLRLQERYWLDRPLARGGVCAVYRGMDEVLSRRVAIKAVPPAHVAAYRAALQVTSALAHPAAVMVLDAVVHQEWLFLIQEYVDGTSLTKRLETGLDIADALNMALQIAGALAYAHHHQIVHGDLTPTAVLIERDRGVRLNNFALPPDAGYFASLPETEATLARALSLSGVAGGDGEQALATPAADIRAVGLLLWQALATAGQLGDRRDFRADVPADVRHLVARAVVRSHPERIATADELVGALQALYTSFTAMQQEEEQPTPPALHRAREAAAEDASWSQEDTIITGQPWGALPPAAPGPISGPLRRSASSGPLREPVPSGPLRAPRLSGPLPPYAPPSQPRPARPNMPIPWIDDPEVARYAASPSGRAGRSRPPKTQTRPPLGLERRGFRALPVVVVGVVLFIACFVAGYVMPLVLSLH